MLNLAKKTETIWTLFIFYFLVCVFVYSNQILTSLNALGFQAEDLTRRHGVCFQIGCCKVGPRLTGRCQVLSYTPCPQSSHEHHILWSIMKSLVSEINYFIFSSFDRDYSTSNLWERLVAFA